MRKTGKGLGLAAGLLVALGSLTGGCMGDLVANLVEERTGDVTVVFINDTPYRAGCSFGSYDAFDRSTTADVTLAQQLVEAKTSTAPITLPCRRNTAVGTEFFIRRVLDTDTQLRTTYNPDIFGPLVNFSSAPLGSEAEALPTEGTAEGIEVRLGVDYAWGDQLIFTFVEDAEAPGGFRIEYSLLHATQPDS